MEIPLASDFAQASALFNDTSETERRNEILGLWPNELPNKHIESLDLVAAASVSNLDKEFRTKDYEEAYRLYTGVLQYPFQNKAQIFHHKFDPYYWDGSELDGDYNVQENLIGTPLGASTLEDPRMTYVANILQMKELHGANDPLDNAYLQNLYMLNTDKGSNYYQNQLQKLNFAMNQHSRLSKAGRHVPLHSIQFSKNLATGNPTHVKHTAKRKISMPSAAGLHQQSRKQTRMAQLDLLTPTHSVKSSVPSLKSNTHSDVSSVGSYGSDVRQMERVFSHTGENTVYGGSMSNGFDYRELERSKYKSSIILPTDPTGHEELVNDGQSVYSDETLIMSTMGDAETSSVPHTITQEMANLNRKKNWKNPGLYSESENRTLTREEMDELRAMIDDLSTTKSVTFSLQSPATKPSRIPLEAVQYPGSFEEAKTPLDMEIQQKMQTPISDLTMTPWEPTETINEVLASREETRRARIQMLRDKYSETAASTQFVTPQEQRLATSVPKLLATPAGVASLSSDFLAESNNQPTRAENIRSNVVPVNFSSTKKIPGKLKISGSGLRAVSLAEETKLHYKNPFYGFPDPVQNSVNEYEANQSSRAGRLSDTQVTKSPTVGKLKTTIDQETTLEKVLSDKRIHR